MKTSEQWANHVIAQIADYTANLALKDVTLQKIRALLLEVPDCSKDAERYRFLRNEAYEAVIPHGGTLLGKRTAWITKLHAGETFDAAIDAAITNAAARIGESK